MKITVHGDSGPYAIYSKFNEVYSKPVEAIEVPDAVYERYDKAYQELTAAQDALDESIREAEGPRLPVDWSDLGK